MFQVRKHPEKPIVWWYSQRSKINMEPVYQREGKLWSKSKKAKLIDSILNDFDIPKIYVADFNRVSTKLNENEAAYAVIDGKQRLETFFEFIDGGFPLADDFRLNSDLSLQLAGLYYLDLKLNHTRVAEKFESYVPLIMSVITDEEGKVDEMFVRLNSGLEINGAERQNAMPGIIPRRIRHMVLVPFFTQSISFDASRMAQYNLAAKIFMIEDRKRFVDTKARNLDKFVLEGVTSDTKTFEAAAKRTTKWLKVMAQIFLPKDPILRSAGAIPLYYWLVRNYYAKRHLIRAFLEEFLKELRENFELAKESPRKAMRADAELSQFYTMGRTTNDQGSLVGRYDILDRRFNRFVKRAKR